MGKEIHPTADSICRQDRPVAAIRMHLAVTVLPAAVGRRISAGAAIVEGRSGVGWLGILAVVCHWIGRLSRYG
jgi:hypothetical protein